MNSNQINYNNITFKIVRVVWMHPRTGEISKEKQNENDREVFCLKDSKGGTWHAERILPWMRFNETPKNQEFRLLSQVPSWYKKEVGGYKRGVERHAFRKKLEFDIIPKAVELLRLKQQLSPNTFKTFGELIDEL